MARILVIDDDAVIAELICSVLLEGGHEATAVPTPDGVRPDGYELVVADLLMTGPYRAGDAAARVSEVRARFPGVPVLVCTAHRGAANDAAEMSADAVLMKPFDVEMLLSTVRRLTERAG